MVFYFLIDDTRVLILLFQFKLCNLQCVQYYSIVLSDAEISINKRVFCIVMSCIHDYLYSDLLF